MKEHPDVRARAGPASADSNRRATRRARKLANVRRMTARITQRAAREQKRS